MNAAPLVVFRADADAMIGGGHVMRCLTLAAAFQRSGWTCAFASIAGSAETVPPLAKSDYAIIPVPGDPVADARCLLAHFSDKADLLVIDHPTWTAIEERPLSAAAVILMAIDGLERRHATQFWLDPNPDHKIEDLLQRAAPGCEILLGLPFMPIAAAVAAARDASLSRRRDQGFRMDKVLVNFGAGDQIAALEVVLRGIADFGRKLRLTVVAGSRAARCQALARDLAVDCEVLAWSDRLGDLMSETDLMIGAGGISAWERCCLGLPSLIVTVAENQLGTAGFLDSRGAAVNLGPADSLNSGKIAESLAELTGKAGALERMSTAAAGLVDGAGAERVAAAVIRHRRRASPEPAA